MKSFENLSLRLESALFKQISPLSFWDIDLYRFYSFEIFSKLILA
jgi:hypothetical protein